MSPYYIFFGREPMCPRLTESDEAKALNAKRNKFLSDLGEKVKAIHEEANRRADEKRRREAETYNRKTKHVPFDVGDKVWEHVDVRHKLQPKYSGPVTVRERVRNDHGQGTTYVCERKNGSVCRKNYEQLKKVNAIYEEYQKLPKPNPAPQLTVASLLPIFMLRSDDTENLVPTPEAASVEHRELPGEPGTATAATATPSATASVEAAAAPVATAATAASTPATPAPAKSALPTIEVTSPVVTNLLIAGEPQNSRTTPSATTASVAAAADATLTPTLAPNTIAEAVNRNSPPPRVETPPSPTTTENDITPTINQENLVGTTGEEELPSVAPKTAEAPIGEVNITEPVGKYADDYEVGESSGLSLQAVSASEHDLGFLADSAQNSIYENVGLKIDTPASREYESGSSPENFVTPGVSLAKGASGNISAKTARKKGKTPKAKRPIDLLNINVTPLAEPSDLPSGEVDSEPDTPVTICPAYEVFAPESNAYLVKSPSGTIPVIRIDTTETQNNQSDQVSEKEALRREISPTGGRIFTGKMRTTGARARASSEISYPISRVSKANTIREARSVERTNDEIGDKSDANSANLPKRGPDGRFRKKTPSK